MVTTSFGARAAGAAGAVLADLVLGEPPARVHPVAVFGTGMQKLEDRCWTDSYEAGLQFAGAGVVVAAAAGAVVTAAAGAVVTAVAGAEGATIARRLPGRGDFSWLGTALGCAIAANVTTAGRALGEEAFKVRDAIESGDLGRARSNLPSLVGRDTKELDEKEMVRAVVESVAENTVDAIVAPLTWAVVFGAPATFAYRAVNTLDSMVGHRSARYLRFGWASAKADDVANWVPARLTALLVMVARPSKATGAWRAVRSGARNHPSPNAGVAEAAFAGALGIQLGGESTYGGHMENRPLLGDGRPAELADIERAVRLSRDVSVVLAGALALVGLVGPFRAGLVDLVGLVRGGLVARSRS
jgi:adenosylcobinamide-phosphate synthase